MTYNLVMDCAKEIESVLKHRYGASGRGLGENAHNVKDKLGKPLFKKILFLNTIRNSVAHDLDYILDEKTRKEFVKVSIECKRILGIQPSGSQNYQKKTYDIKDDSSNEKDWAGIKTQQKIIYKKLKASIIAMIMFVLFFTFIMKFL